MTSGRAAPHASHTFAASRRPLELWSGLECTLNRVGDRQHDQLALARHYGFSIKSVVARFVMLRLEQGEGFDSLAEVRRLLLDATAGEQERITQTEQYFAVAMPRD